jgi:hypothetical protein
MRLVQRFWQEKVGSFLLRLSGRPSTSCCREPCSCTLPKSVLMFLKYLFLNLKQMFNYWCFLFFRVLNIEIFYSQVFNLASLAHSDGTKSFVGQNSYSTAMWDILSDNIAGLPSSRYQYASLIVGGFGKDSSNQRRSQWEKCIVVSYLSYFIVSWMNSLRSINIRQFQ